jgi:hypothetical protein
VGEQDTAAHFFKESRSLLGSAFFVSNGKTHLTHPGPLRRGVLAADLGRYRGHIYWGGCVYCD